MANLNAQNIGTNYRGILNLDATTINTPLDATLRAVTDGMGNQSSIALSTTKIGLKSLGTASATGVQYGSTDLVLLGSSWNGSTAIDAIWIIKQLADLTQNNFPRLVGDYNGVQFLRLDKSSELTTYNYLGHTCIGYEAGASLATTGGNTYNNAFIGGHAGKATTTGYQNTFIGNRSGVENTTGYQNTFVGQGSGYQNTTGFGSVCVGFHAGLNVTSERNTFIGSACGQGAVGATALGNSAFGYNALQVISSGIDNVAVGRSSGVALTTANYNSFIGTNVAISLTTGSSNVMIGRLAGYTDVAANASTTTANSVFIGNESGQGSTTQLTNAIAIGYRAKVDANNTVVLGNTSIVKTILRGTINAANLPTSAAGLVTGDIYNNLGVLTIVS
jgi:hypothetical protein